MFLPLLMARLPVALNRSFAAASLCADVQAGQGGG